MRAILLCLLLAGCARPVVPKDPVSATRAFIPIPTITLTWSNWATGLSAAQMSGAQVGLCASPDFTNWQVIWTAPWTNWATATVPATNGYQFYRAFGRMTP